jgi:hypothetical protein
LFSAIPFGEKRGGKKQHTKDKFEENEIPSLGLKANPEKHRQNNDADRRCQPYGINHTKRNDPTTYPPL